ncbi:hypothetical protein HDU97_003640 [Phlyctochytrium planicorne]|nr:hypothetical protein HDU97_003640 [Phlyctochytrium planicorne]
MSHRICVVGAGPAGLYTIQKLLSLPNVWIDLIDRLPVPFGLIRYGIAPDHPDAKNVIHRFEKTLEDPRVRFIGNVEIGQKIAVSDLLQHYNQVVLSYGASQDKKLGISGEEAIVGAPAIVNWYNGMFGCHECPVDLLSTDTSVVIGQGNVALDIARMLLRPVDTLRTTETPMPVLEALSHSKIRNVHIVGRRGPEKISMTAKELREMLHISGLKCRSDWPLVDSSLLGIDSSVDRSKKRVLEMLSKYGSTSDSGENSTERNWDLDFWHSPSRVLLEGSGGAIAGVSFNVKPPGESEGRERLIRAGVVVRSIGYKSTGFESIPFDSSKSVIPNSLGRAMDLSGRLLPGLYVSGWLKRGPVGVVAATMYDAFETANSMIEDLSSPALTVGGFETFKKLLEKLSTRTYSFDDWKRIDKYEVEEGQRLGKLREKITSMAKLNAVLDHAII